MGTCGGGGGPENRIEGCMWEGSTLLLKFKYTTVYRILILAPAVQNVDVASADFTEHIIFNGLHVGTIDTSPTALTHLKGCAFSEAHNELCCVLLFKVANKGNYNTQGEKWLVFLTWP